MGHDHSHRKKSQDDPEIKKKLILAEMLTDNPGISVHHDEAPDSIVETFTVTRKVRNTGEKPEFNHQNQESQKLQDDKKEVKYIPTLSKLSEEEKREKWLAEHSNDSDPTRSIDEEIDSLLAKKSPSKYGVEVGRAKVIVPEGNEIVIEPITKMFDGSDYLGISKEKESLSLTDIRVMKKESPLEKEVKIIGGRTPVDKEAHKGGICPINGKPVTEDKEKNVFNDGLKGALYFVTCCGGYTKFVKYKTK